MSDVAPLIRSLSAQHYARPTRVTFVLPGAGRSGGVRVTAEMAARLSQAGYPTRIVYHKGYNGPVARVERGSKSLWWKLHPGVHNDWLEEFPGSIEKYSHLQDLQFARGEMVIAVGSWTICDVLALDAPGILKVRYCHGLQRYIPDEMKQVWGPPMPTLAVCRSMVPDLKAYGQEERIWVVPNGIDGSQYYCESLCRDGVGTIYGRNYAKNPEFILGVISQLRRTRPYVKRYVFGAHLRPRSIRWSDYWTFPSVAKARELYNRAKIWLLLSRTEGFPGPILEAMACGCAVISTEHDGSRELIQDGFNGIRIPVDDAARCLKAIELLWEDTAFREQLIKAGFDTVRHYSWENAVLAMQRAIDEIIRCANT
jgi:glycosyltransferase involved in cell wall biosynthesis